MPAEFVPQSVAEALQAGHFFLAPPGKLHVACEPSEVRRWEEYRGHLLDAALARESTTFTTWHVSLAPDAQPLIAVHWQSAANRVHVTRNILTHAFEAYEDTPGVILSRPTQKWTTELVGTVDVEAAGEHHLASEIEALILLAIIGTSRLPITSLENPLPTFSLGTLAYLPGLASLERACDDALPFLSLALDRELPPLEHVKALETALRAIRTERVGEVAHELERAATQPGRGATWAEALLRGLFNGAALSPYTSFAGTMVRLIEALAKAPWFGPARALVTLSYMLRHLVRHLTAFDLVLFHNYGANYPDALFLDALLQAYLRLIENTGDELRQPPAALLRRALRQALLTRRQYEGHRVPDAPTSLGENVRVLPQPFARVAEEQILDPSKRRRELFADEPSDSLLGPVARDVFAQSLTDLDQSGELRELGMAVFLDRPLGVLHESGAVDRTQLVSYEAFSRLVARRRLAALKSARWIDAARHEALVTQLKALPVSGMPVAELGAAERPGVVSVGDALKAAPDFLLLRTTRSSLQALLAHYELEPLRKFALEAYDRLTADPHVLLVQHRSGSTGVPFLRLYVRDELWLELGFAPGDGEYVQRRGIEVPRRLQILGVRQADGALADTSATSLWLEALN